MRIKQSLRSSCRTLQLRCTAKQFSTHGKHSSWKDIFGRARESPCTRMVEKSVGASMESGETFCWMALLV